MVNTLEIDFDSSAYSVTAVQKACYRFTNIASFEVKTDDASKTRVICTALGEKSDEGMQHLGQLLRNEVLDQHLREKIRTETEGVRNLILAHAFSKTGLIKPDGAAPEA